MRATHIGMNCIHAPNYMTGCEPCGARKIVMLRSPDKRLTLQLQKQVLSGYSLAGQERIKQMVKGAA